MSAPVILIGIDGNGLGVVGLYESEEAAAKAVQRYEVPAGYSYGIHTPAMNGYSARRKYVPTEHICDECDRPCGSCQPKCTECGYGQQGWHGVNCSQYQPRESEFSPSNVKSALADALAKRSKP